MEALGHLDLDTYEVAYIYADFRAIYSPSETPKNLFLEMVIDRLLRQIDNVLIPSFTYTTKGIFDPNFSVTKLGALNRYLQMHSHSYTSNHPLFSYTAIGPASKNLLKDIGTSAFGDDSLLDRLAGRKCIFLHLGRPPQSGNTLVHRVEQIGQASYRQEIEFDTKVFRDGISQPGPYTAYMRPISDAKAGRNSVDFQAASKYLIERGAYSQVYWNSEFDAIWKGDFDLVFSELKDLYDKDCTIFTSPIRKA